MDVKLIHPDAQMPNRQTPGSAGYDLCCIEGKALPPRSQGLLSTGLCLTVPEGTYGQIAPRSGLSMKGIDVGAGVIDRDYTGEIKVLLRNHSDVTVCVKPGDRIAQLIVKKIEVPEIHLVDSLQPTDRGDGGFGSTGK